MAKTNTQLSAVAEELRDLDLKFRTGCDLDVVEWRYACKLVDGISRDDKVLKCEALKSLGDLSLHKAKLTDHKTENFHRACALYNELLRHCESEEEKQVPQHRIKHAEKCTKLVLDEEQTNAKTGVVVNTTLGVSVTLREVEEMAKMEGHAELLLVVAYSSFFVEGIVDGNMYLERESLKSLGDLYLQKGRVGKNEAAFTKAAGLYRAALDRCEDSDGRETLEHRIKYADKVKEKVLKKRPANGVARNRKAGNDEWFTLLPTSPQSAHGVAVSSQRSSKSIRTYEDHLQEGCRALQTGDLDRAEQEFAAALKSVHAKGQFSEETEPLCMLGDVCLKRGIQSKDGVDFTKAAALCNAALARAKDETRESIKQAIYAIIQSFHKHVLGIERTVDIDESDKHKLMLKTDREHVEEEMKRIEEQANPYSLDDDHTKIREVEKKRADEIKALCQTIADQRRTFISGLVDECMEVMGPPPCKYAMVGLGSQATGLATPYSDLEFAILIEEETEHHVTYFRNLTHLLHLKVISLGETILPAMGIKSLNDFSSDDPLDNWYYDSVTPRGFAFDGAMPHACKTPLGRGQTSSARSELIQTPSKMVDVLKCDLTFHLKKGYHLASILGNVCLIKGEQDLVDVYTSLWTQQLDKTILSSMAQTILHDNAPIFKVQPMTARLLHVKKEIYRFSSIAVCCWALFYNIQPTTIWETIQTLRNNGVINSENAHHLMVLVSISAELRLRTYMNNGSQMENVSVLSAVSTDIGEKLQKVFYCSNAKQLMRYYYTARPLKLFVSQLANGNLRVSPATLFNNAAKLKAEVYQSLCDYEKSRTFQELTLQTSLMEHGFTHPSTVVAFRNLGFSCCNLGEYREAGSYYEYALQIMRLIFRDCTADPDFVEILSNLGFVWYKLGDLEQAVRYHEQSLQMNRAIFGAGAAHPGIAKSLSDLGTTWRGLGDYRRAVSFGEQALQMRRSVYGENTAHPDISLSLNSLGSVWCKLGDYKKAVSYFEQSLRMEKDLYGDNTVHPDIAVLLTNLGTAYHDLGYYRKAVSCLQQSLKMMRSIYGENAAHPDIAGSLNRLGSVWNDLGVYQKAVYCYEQSVPMMQSIYGENTSHPDIAKTFHNLGGAWERLGDCRKAIMYYEQALQMEQRIYGEDTAHRAIAGSLHNLGSAWRKLGDHGKALIYCKQSLLMLRTLYGEDTAHPHVAGSLTLLGGACLELGDHREAVSYYERSLQMCRKIYGENTAHPDIAASLHNLGTAWTHLGDQRKAISYFEQGLSMVRTIHGENTPHPHTARSLSNLGHVWMEIGDDIKAVRYFEESLQMMRSIHGKNTVHPDIAVLLGSLGVAWTNLGDHRMADRYIEQAAQMISSMEG